MTHQRQVLCFLILCSLVMIGIGDSATAQQANALTTNLLVNGNFDELPFYWAYPNHFIPGGWDRWWIHGSVLPEFDDIKGGRQYIRVDGEHALVYFKWGDTYTAGVFQVVNGLTPCRPYQLTMYARTHSLAGALPHARIGLDPVGAQLTPDGAVHDQTPLNRTIWSPEQTALFTWEELSVTAEPLGSSLTAILYASPQPGSGQVHYFDTFWDAGKLVMLNFSNGLPEPAQWSSAPHITGIATSTSATTATINWQTTIPALTEIRYEVIRQPLPPAEYDYRYFLPLVSMYRAPEVNYTPGQTHSKTLTGLQSGDVVRFWVLARMPVSAACVTEGLGPIEITIP